MPRLVLFRGFLVDPMDLVEKGTRVIFGDIKSPVPPKVKSGLAKTSKPYYDRQKKSKSFLEMINKTEEVEPDVLDLELLFDVTAADFENTVPSDDTFKKQIGISE